MGNRATIKATAQETDGVFSMLEFVAEPGASASPPHAHTREEECLYVLEGRLVVTVGLSDVIIVDTPDALLVCARDRAEEIKPVLDEIAEKAGERYL